MTAPDTTVPALVVKFAHGALGIVRSLGRMGVPVWGVDSRVGAPELRSRFLRGMFRWDVESAPPLESVARLLAIGRTLGPKSVLVPTSDKGALFVAENAAALRERFLFPEQAPDLVRSLVEKEKMYPLVAGLGFDAPRAAFPRSRAEVLPLAREIGFPVVLRGEDTTLQSGLRDHRMIVVHDADELRAESSRCVDGAGLMLREYIPGDAAASWMFNGYFDASSRCLASYSGRKVRQYPIHTGPTSLGQTEPSDRLERTAQALARALSYRGVVDLDFCLDARDGRLKLLDFNPRIGSTFRLFRGEDGMDVARCLYLDLTGQAVACGPAPAGRRWVVEDSDLRACFGYRREGRLGCGEWLRSLRGIEEGAWFASDDTLPFWLMCAGFVRDGIGAARRRLARNRRT